MSLIYAVKKGNVNAVKKLLNNGANVNQNIGNGSSPLIQASSNGNLELVKLLLAKGANVNKASKEGWTPLYEASYEGHPYVVKVLLAAPGIDVNKADKFGKTPLYGASYLGHTEVVKVLLANPGVDVNKADKRGETPLYRASWDDHTEVVKLLLRKRGIDVNKANNEGDTPLNAASYRGRIEIAKMLLAKGADVNKTGGKHGDTPLIIASWKGYTEMVKFLLDKGADANKMDKDGDTALHSASEEDHAGIVEILLKAGADPNKANNKGDTPLLVATRWGHVTTIRALLKSRGIQVDKVNKEGRTPLMIASQYGALFCARALLKAGANVNKAKPDGFTALHIASFNDNVDVVKELLAAKGIDPFKQNVFGKTALDQAKSPAVKKLLKDAMGFKTLWKNMNNEQRRGMKPILLKRMIAKGLKNGKNATFTEPIIYANYNYRTLKPVNKRNKKINSVGLVIDNKNEVKYLLDMEGARKAINTTRDRAIREGKTVKQKLPGIIFENWSLVNFTRNEYFKALKDLEKLSVLRKGKRTRNNLKSGRMNRIEENQLKTKKISTLRKTVRNAQKELNKLI